jgi:bifunctional UDP-N-acetylglucosamine pyrophosphorylase / glucosamine-1-phosphate N-acetyltransferase
VATTRPGRLAEVAGVNDRVQLAALERDYQRHAAQDLMRAGVTLADPARSICAGDSMPSPMSHRHQRVIEGDVRLSTGVRIGPNCLLKDCSIGPGPRSCLTR